MADIKKDFKDDVAIELGEVGERDREGDELLAPRTNSMPPNPASSMFHKNEAPISILAYCLSSILMTVTNKYVLSGRDFNLNFFLLGLQSVTCVVVITTAKAAGFITFRDFHSDEARKWFPVSLLLVGMIYSGTWALRFLSIPVYTIFKNLTIILIAYGERLWFGGGAVSPITLFSFGLMVLSSIVAAWADIQHALSSAHSPEHSRNTMSTLNAGYVWMFANCFCTSSYILYMRKRIKLTNFTDFDTMYYNNLLTIPVLVVASLVAEDWSTANLGKNFPPESRNSLLTAILVSGASSAFISYTSAWCVRKTSSTTYSMVGMLNKLPIALSGLVFFNAPVTFGSVTAIALGFVSGLVYAYAKQKEKSDAGRRLGLPTSGQGVVSASSQSMKDSLK